MSDYLKGLYEMARNGDQIAMVQAAEEELRIKTEAEEAASEAMNPLPPETR